MKAEVMNADVLRAKDDPNDDPGDPQKERDELKKVVLHSFTANPPNVKTLGSVALAWNVTLPPVSPFDIQVKLNGQDVDPIGSATRTLLQTTPFTLSAATDHAGRQLRTLTVHVDGAECRTQTTDPFAITQPLKTEFDKRFTGSSAFKLSGNGTSVTLGNETINISVPLTINVPDWFDADMSITIQLKVIDASPVTVIAPIVSADVSWSFFENLASLGCGHFVESGMTKMAEAFLGQIVQTELIPVVRKGLTDVIASFEASLKAADPGHRTFALGAFVLSPAGLKITACPK
jgi:hypothetical protein